MNVRANGYRDLPEFPTEAPDPSVRNVEPPPSVRNEMFNVVKSKGGRKKKTFYSESESSKGSGSTSEGSGKGSGDSEDSSEDSSSSSDDDSSTDAQSANEDKKSSNKIQPPKARDRKVVRYKDGLSSGSGGGSESGTASSSEDNSDSSSSSEESADEEVKKNESNFDLLVDLDYFYAEEAESSLPPSNGNGTKADAENPPIDDIPEVVIILIVKQRLVLD